MTETYQELLEKQAFETKKKRENIIAKNLPYPCKKCWEEKFPEEFVMQYIENPIAGKYRYLYECKQCKKDRGVNIPAYSDLLCTLQGVCTTPEEFAKQQKTSIIIISD